MDNEKRAGFTSSFGAVAAAAGSAIGLGNIWRFPYTVGQNGGGAFLLIYIIFVFMLGVPLIMSEFIMGRRSGHNVLGAFRTLAPQRKGWLSVGWLAILSSFMIYSFYSVVAGWTFNYIVLAGAGKFEGQSSEAIAQIFENFTTHAWHPIFFLGLFIFFTAAVVVKGVQKGIEKTCKVLMPVLLLLMILLCVRSVTLDGAGKGLEFLFEPDFSALTAGSVLSALGQALFSLSLGMGCLVTYGSYIRKEDNLLKTSVSIAAADTLIAVLAGVAIFPAVFAFGMSPASGPSLVYEVLPNVFNAMPLGIVFATLFFVLLTIAALTSTISLLEILVAWAVEELHMKRIVATIFCSVIVFAIGVLCSLSFGPLSDFTIGGQTIFGLFDKLTATYFMPIGALALTIFVGWQLTKEDSYDELSNGGMLQCSYYKVWRFMVRYLAPLALAIILIAGSLGAEI
ncbi:MAG: sodium-dependent transporter [Bacteroidales bacterium]|nr:sodium-dependent transporter [Bacteroidales bacterium]